MKIEVTKKDVIWSYIGYFFSVFVNLIILPFIVKFVSSKELGLWYTFISVGQIVSIFDGTFTRSISRNITYAWSGVGSIQAEGYAKECNQYFREPNYRLLVSVLKTCHIIFLIVSFLALFLLITAGTYYISIISKGVNYNLYLYSWFIYILGVFLNLYYSYWITSLRGVGAIQQAQKASVLSRIIQIVVSLIGLYLGYGLVVLSIAYLVSGITLRMYAKTSFMKYKNIKLNYEKYKSDISMGEIKSNYIKIWYNAKKNFLSCIGTYGITQSTPIICSAYLGLEETASYGLSMQIISTIAAVAMIYFNIVQPQLTSLKIQGKNLKEKFENILFVSTTIYWIFYWVILLGFVVIGLPMINILKSDTEVHMSMILFMGGYVFLENNHHLFSSVIEMSNTVPYVRANIISSMFILVLELILAKFTANGIYGLMFVQFFVQLSYNNWKWPYIIFKEYHTTPLKILKIGIVSDE